MLIFPTAATTPPTLKTKKIKKNIRRTWIRFLHFIPNFAKTELQRRMRALFSPIAFTATSTVRFAGGSLSMCFAPCFTAEEERPPKFMSLVKSCLKTAKKIAPGVFGSFEAQYAGYTDTPDFNIEPEENENGILPRQSVELLSLTPDCAKRVAEFALIENLNLSSSQIEKLVNDSEKRKEIIRQTVSLTRSRPLEAVSCTVRFNDVSLSTLTHFTRHRMQSIGIPALSSCKRDSYIIPESVKENELLFDKYIEAFEKTAALFEKMKAKGYTESETVYCLLSGNTLDFVTTMNGRELLLFMKLRSCNRAQWEIRNYAVELLGKLREADKELFSFFGPSCYTTGICPEGKLTCGKIKEVKEISSAE